MGAVGPALCGPHGNPCVCPDCKRGHEHDPELGTVCGDCYREAEADLEERMYGGR